MVMTVQVVGQFKISVMFISFRRKCLDYSDFLKIYPHDLYIAMGNKNH